MRTPRLRHATLSQRPAFPPSKALLHHKTTQKKRWSVCSKWWLLLCILEIYGALYTSRQETRRIAAEVSAIWSSSPHLVGLDRPVALDAVPRMRERLPEKRCTRNAERNPPSARIVPNRASAKERKENAQLRGRILDPTAYIRASAYLSLSSPDRALRLEAV